MPGPAKAVAFVVAIRAVGTESEFNRGSVRWKQAVDGPGLVVGYIEGRIGSRDDVDGAASTLPLSLWKPLTRVTAGSRMCRAAWPCRESLIIGFAARFAEALTQIGARAEPAADGIQVYSMLLEEGRAAASLRFAGTSDRAARSIIAALEGAMLVSRPYGNTAMLDSVGDRLIAELSVEAMSN
jgi:hypothetical protein